MKKFSIPSLFLLFSVFAISGCANWKIPEKEVVTVYVPRYECPIDLDIVQIPEKPELHIRNITVDSTYGEIAVSYVVSIEQLRDYSSELRAKLELVIDVCSPIDENT